MDKLNTILLVDDDPVANFINKRLLERLDIAEEVKLASNGDEGIRFLNNYYSQNQRLPEVIFLDINMPVMNGFDFLEAFQDLEFKNKQEVKIIVLTTSTHPVDKEKVEPFGISGFTNKPLSIEKIKELLGTMVTLL